MSDVPETKGEYQAQVHFALGAVIQGITVAALGNEIAAALRALPFPGAIWIFITGLQSLLLCIAFWYNFIGQRLLYFMGYGVRSDDPLSGGLSRLVFEALISSTPRITRRSRVSPNASLHTSFTKVPVV